MNLYDRFIGRWEAEAQAFLPDGSSRRHHWQIRFERVLEGRAIQDVWITRRATGPMSASRSAGDPSTTSTA